MKAWKKCWLGIWVGSKVVEKYGLEERYLGEQVGNSCSYSIQLPLKVTLIPLSGIKYWWLPGGVGRIRKKSGGVCRLEHDGPTKYHVFGLLICPTHLMNEAYQTHGAGVKSER